MRNILLFFLAVIFISSCENKDKNSTSKPQPVIVAKKAKIIEEHGLQFKDLNKNNKIDAYEDWRLTTAERVKDLLEKMTTEEKVGLLLVSDIRMKNEDSLHNATSSGFNEKDIIVDTNYFTGDSLPAPIIEVAGTTKGIEVLNLRHFILRTNTTPKMIALWSNKLQTLSENTRLGIPVLVSSLPRNNSYNVVNNAPKNATNFSQWPGELGLAATRDMKLINAFAKSSAREWKAVGLRNGLMYAADLGTDPRWQKYAFCFGENADLVSNIMKEIVPGFQGDGITDSSISLTIKHFPGGGSTDNGRDPHFAFGSKQSFPAGMLANNIAPFKVAVTAKASSILPYYALPEGTNYEQVAYGFNEGILKKLLRTELGFKGIVMSEPNIIEMMPWGVEKLSIGERYAKAFKAGMNLFTGNADPQPLLQAINDSVVKMDFVNTSASLVLTRFFDLGLFENPYVNEPEVNKVFADTTTRLMADTAFRKSIVLLRNEKEMLPLKPHTKIFFEVLGHEYENKLNHKGKILTPNNDSLQFVPSLENADVAVLWLQPQVRPWYVNDSSEINLLLSQCGLDVHHIQKIIHKKPVILVINYTNPFIINEIYDDAQKGNVHAVLATFGSTQDALIDVLSGKFNPSGKMPFSTPISQLAVINNKEDKPGFMEGNDYPLFQYDEGLRYK